MSRLFTRMQLAALALAGLTTVSLADDWTAVRLRGEVFVYRDTWIKLERGDVVSDDSIIRTLGRGRVSFERGAETIDLLPNSQIRILDQTGRKFTTVLSDYGKVAIEAEVQNVEHFSVATPFLAAVVKGTRFSVSSSSEGSAVSVERGQVFVEDNSSHDSVTIVAGQTASSDSSPSTSGETLVVTTTPAHTPKTVATPSVVPSATTSSSVSDQSAPADDDHTSVPGDDSDDEDDTSGLGGDNGNEDDNSGPGDDNGNENDNSGSGNDGDEDNSSGPGDDEGNEDDNSDPGNHNGPGNDNGNHNGQGNDNGNHNGHGHDDDDDHGNGNGHGHHDHDHGDGRDRGRDR